MAEYEAIIGTDDNLNVDVSADIDVPVTVTDNGFVSMSVEPDASVLSIDAEVEPDEIIDVPVQEGLGGISSDHRLLLHRDASNQHPMSAIAGLEDALDNLESTLETRIIGAEDDITELSLVEEADRITMANAVIRIDRDITLLQSQVDGNITTWFYNYVPTLGNEPASDWIQAGEEAVHLGDLFYNTDTGYAYRWMSDSANPPTYSWTRITDSDVTKALADAAKAQDTADHKRRVFITTPTPPYDAGDLWFVGVSGDILTCTHSRLESEYYDAGDWSKLHKYTDDTRANEAYTLANNAKLSADGKNRIYRQNSQPTGGVYGAGDVWFDTAHDNKIYRYDGSSWVAVTLGDDAIGELNASHITAGEIDASQITVSNLDAGNITTGYLDADRLDVDSIIASKSILVSGDDISSLNNDSGYQNSTQVDNAITSKGYQTAGDVSSAIDTATSGLLTSVSTKDRYYLSTSSSEPTGGSWQDTVPTWSSGKYIWTRVATTKTTSSGSTTTYSTAVYDSALTGALSDITTKADKTAAASTVVTTKQYYLSTSSSSATGSSWGDSVPTWTTGKYIWVRFKIVTTPISGTASTTYTPSENGIYDSALTVALQTSSDAAPKSGAINKTVSVYYRSTTQGAPTITTSTVIGTSADTDNAWEYVMPAPKRDRYFYTCEEYTYANNSKDYSAVRELSNATYTSKWVSSADATYMDGGRLYANSVTADQINASTLTISSMGDSSSYSNTTQMNTAIGTAVDGIEIGGRNLHKKSEAIDSSWTIQNGTNSNGTVTLTRASSETRIYQMPANGYWTWQPSTTYTASIEAKGNAGGETLQFACNGGGTVSYATNNPTITTEWKRYTRTFTTASTGITTGSMSYLNATNNSTIQVRNPKLELGNKATDWTPAPEDAVNENLLIDSQKMSAWTKGSSASLDTTDEFGVISLAGTNADWSSNVNSRPTMRVSVLDGTPLWLSFEYKASAAITALQTVFAGTNAEEGSASGSRTKYAPNSLSSLPAASSWTRKVVALPTLLSDLTNASGDVNSVYIQFYNRTNGATLQIRKVKIEHGLYATDWTPSSEEQKAYITRIDDAGIRIHPSNTTNNSVLLNGDGMEIFKGGTTSAYSVAKYGDTARIGKASSYNVQIDSDSIDFVDNGETVVSIASESTSTRKNMELSSSANANNSSLSFSNYYNVDTNGGSIVGLCADGGAFTYLFLESIERNSSTNEITAETHLELQPDKIEVHGPVRMMRQSYNQWQEVYVSAETKNQTEYIKILSYDASNNCVLGQGQWAKNTSGYNTYVEGYETNIWGRNKIATNMAITQGSDKRLKKDIKDIKDIENFVMDLKPVEFKYEFANDSNKHFGFIAQDVEKSMNTYELDSNKYGLLTEITGTDNIQYKGLNYTEFIPLCVKMIQKQQKEIEELKEALNEILGN